MPEIVLDTNEKVALIGALCDKLKWSYGYGHGRADMIQVAERLVVLCEALPDEGDAA